MSFYNLFETICTELDSSTIDFTSYEVGEYILSVRILCRFSSRLFFFLFLLSSTMYVTHTHVYATELSLQLLYDVVAFFLNNYRFFFSSTCVYMCLVISVFSILFKDSRVIRRNQRQNKRILEQIK